MTTNHETDHMARGLLLGFFGGTMVGAIAALLFAPKAGKDFRADIVKSTDQLLDETSRRLEDAKGKTADAIDKASGKSREMISDGLDKASGVIAQAKARINAHQQKETSAGTSTEAGT
jgi:gas vesicle protein